MNDQIDKQHCTVLILRGLKSLWKSANYDGKGGCPQQVLELCQTALGNGGSSWQCCARSSFQESLFFTHYNRAALKVSHALCKCSQADNFFLNQTQGSLTAAFLAERYKGFAMKHKSFWSPPGFRFPYELETQPRFVQRFSKGSWTFLAKLDWFMILCHNYTNHVASAHSKTHSELKHRAKQIRAAASPLPPTPLPIKGGCWLYNPGRFMSHRLIKESTLKKFEGILVVLICQELHPISHRFVQNLKNNKGKNRCSHSSISILILLTK